MTILSRGYISTNQYKSRDSKLGWIKRITPNST
jgi:hypothetical protein